MLGKYSLEIYLLHPIVIKIANFIPIEEKNIFILFTLFMTLFLSYFFHLIYHEIASKIAK